MLHLPTGRLFDLLRNPVVWVVIAGVIVSTLEAFGWGFVRPSDRYNDLQAQVTFLQKDDTLRGSQLTTMDAKIDLLLKSKCLEISVTDAIKLGFHCEQLIPGWPEVILGRHHT